MHRVILAFVLLLAPLAVHAQLAPAVQASVNAACGNCAVGVSIGSPTDQTTWRASFVPGAPAAQQSEAQAALTTFPLATWTAQQAAAATAQTTLAAGLQVTSASTPALNGTYAVDATALQNITSTELYIQVHGTFPGRGTTMGWYDVAGSAHSFPTATEFQTFATAIADCVAALDHAQTCTQPLILP